MASSNKVFVSPGVFTSEKDLTYVTKQVGVTTLGIVGETPKGPAFEPVFIKDYGEFKKFFGSQNTAKFKGGLKHPKYESTYIAKSYLSQSNQLYVSRILGFSGYDAGKAYMIVATGGRVATTTGNVCSNVSYSGRVDFDANGVVTGMSDLIAQDGCSLSGDGSSVLARFFDAGKLTSVLSNITAGTKTYTSNPTATTITIKDDNAFTGVSSIQLRMHDAPALSHSNLSGAVSGTYTTFTASTKASSENKVVCTIRSSAEYDGFENLSRKASGFMMHSAGLTYDNAKANFKISGTSTSTTQPTFDYTVSLDKTKSNYILNVLGRDPIGDGPLYVEELYQNMLDDGIATKSIGGLEALAVTATTFNDYKIKYQPAKTPWILSQVQGTKLKRLFKLWTIGDGDAANSDIKISIQNIKPDEREFDVVVRSFADKDDKPTFLEKFTRCTMDPTSRNFVAKRIGTLDGNYALKSDYVMVELSDEADTSLTFPAGFEGVPVRDYPTGSIAPCIAYKKAYTAYENKRKAYLGLSSAIGVDVDFFTYKGKSNVTDPGYWTATTKGFHMDIDATGCTIDNSEIVKTDGTKVLPSIKFDAGAAQFRTESGLAGGVYEKAFARKFSLAPYGGYDGFDVYRKVRTNDDTYKVNGTKGLSGKTASVFASKTTTLGDNGITSDWYAYYEGIRSFANP